MDDVKRGQLDPDLEAAAFDARPGRLGGPIESQFGWYVFEVTDVTGATRRSLEEARAQIRRILRDRRRQQALGAFTRELAQRYQPRTICADEYATGDCANG